MTETIHTSQPPHRQIRARYSDSTIRVYQAYPPQIARPAVAAQRFVPPFSMHRMTWIKPSFNWMMYRCGWASKPNQEHVLAIDIDRTGFEWFLQNSALSHFEPEVYSSLENWHAEVEQSPVQIQWDPERNWNLERLDYRSIQIGISAEAVVRYVSEYTRLITDLTTETIQIREAPADQRRALVEAITAEEKPYPVPTAIANRIGMPVE